MLTAPFLTDLDSRAAVKGSRDPLGIQQIWTRFGAVSSETSQRSARRFGTSLPCCSVTTSQSGLPRMLGPVSSWPLFLSGSNWRLTPGRLRTKTRNFRGIERVRRNLRERRVTISDHTSHQILSNQKTYGLWGLYTMPARASGLVEGDPTRLTCLAREFVETRYLPLLSGGARRDARQVRDILQRVKPYHINLRTPEPLLINIGRVLDPRLHPTERNFYEHHLLHGGPQDSTAGRQRQLAELLSDTLTQEDFSWSPAAVNHLAKAARNRGEEWHSLAHRLNGIRVSETVLAPASATVSVSPRT